MAGRPRSRPLGVDPGPGEGCSEGLLGAPEPYTNIFVYSRPDVRCEWASNWVDSTVQRDGVSPGPSSAGAAHSLKTAVARPNGASGFWAGFRLDSNRESFKLGPPAGRRPAGGPILSLSRLESNPARKPDFRPGSTIAQQRVTYHVSP